MIMAQYITEMSHAVQTLIPAVWAEHDVIQEISGKVARLEATTERDYQRVGQILSVDENDEDGLATFQHWETYFGVDKDRHQASAELAEARQQEATRSFSRAAMASTILQFAKQGISFVHGELKNAPPGRLIHSLPISEIIWMARNQGLHWEDGSFTKGVNDCFQSLAAHEGVFGNYTNQSMGFEVISLLGWRDCQRFEADLLSLS